MHAAASDRQERGDARLDPSSQRVRHASTRARKPWATYRAPESVSAAGNAHCAETPASASVRRPSVSAGTVAVAVRARSSRPRSRARARRRGARAADRAGSRAGSRSRRSPAAFRSPTLSTRKRPSHRRGRERLVERAARADSDGASSVSQPRRALLARPSRWKPARPRREKYSRGTFSGLAGRLAPAHGHDLRPGRERVQPLGRRCEPGADDGHGRRVVVRLVRVDGARVAAQLVGHVQAGVAGREQHVRGRRRGRRARSRRRPRARARPGMRRRLRSQPLRSRSRSTWARNSSTVGW